jgi:hypothetical protein
MQYPQQILAGGSMYVVQLPVIIPPAGQPGGPPLPADYRYFLGVQNFDARKILLNCVRGPQQLQPTMDGIEVLREQYSKKK